MNSAREAASKAFYECEGNNEACLKAAFDAYEAASEGFKDGSAEMLAALREARAFMMAPAEDLLWGVIHRMDAVISKAAIPSPADERRQP